MAERNLGRAAFHIHTTESDGQKTPQECLELARRMKCDVLVVTDHDTLKGSLAAQDYANRQAEKEKTDANIPQVPQAVEISTAQGHLVALYVREEIPIFRSLAETVKAIHAQGGLAVAPHVGKGLPPASIAPQTIDDLYQKGGYLDGIETKTPCYTTRHEQIVLDLSSQYNIAQIGADDDHHGNLGRGYVTLFEGETASDFRRAIEYQKTVAVKGNLPLLRIPLPRRARQIARGLTWGLPRKIINSPALIASLIALQVERIDQIIK